MLVTGLVYYLKELAAANDKAAAKPNQIADAIGSGDTSKLDESNDDYFKNLGRHLMGAWLQSPHPLSLQEKPAHRGQARQEDEEARLRQGHRSKAVMAGRANAEELQETVAARLPDVPGSRPHFGANSQ